MASGVVALRGSSNGSAESGESPPASGCATGRESEAQQIVNRNIFARPDRPCSPGDQGRFRPEFACTREYTLQFRVDLEAHDATELFALNETEKRSRHDLAVTPRYQQTRGHAPP